MNCAVITPVGPGHEALFQQCKISIENAIAHSKGPFEDIFILAMDDTKAEKGRSRCRNEAVEMADEQKVDWIFFLDADDLMLPSAFQVVAEYVPSYDAIWGAISEQKMEGECGYLRLPQLFSIKNIDELLCFDPFITLQMGHFVKTKVALENPFDEAMNAGEDFDYYLRVWSKYHCIKMDKPLFLNRRGMHSRGPRSATGGDWRKNVEKVINDYCQKRNLSDDLKSEIRQRMTAEFIDYTQKNGLLSQCDPKLCAAYFPAPK